MFSKRFACPVSVALLVTIGSGVSAAAPILDAAGQVMAEPSASTRDMPVPVSMPYGAATSTHFWSGSNDGVDGIRRRVVVSGYHSYEGFAQELAAEQATRLRSTPPRGERPTPY